jgi:hypothetical protein
LGNWNIGRIDDFEGDWEMIVSTDNRMGRAMDWPSLAPNSIALVTDVSAPGTSYQNASYGMNGLGGRSGLGAVFDDITSLNFAALPTDIINGLNPATFDIGAYIVVGFLAYLILPKLFKGSKGAGRIASRKARLTGQIAQDQALLKSNPRRRRRR